MPKLCTFILSSFTSLEDVLTMHLVKGDDRGDQSASDRSRRRRRRSEDRSKRSERGMSKVEMEIVKSKGDDVRRCKAKSVERDRWTDGLTA